MINAQSELKAKIMLLGADLVGFASLLELPEEERRGYSYGICIAKAIDPDIVAQIHHGPNQAYYRAYKYLNTTLGEIARETSAIISKMGYDAYAAKASSDIHGDTLSTVLPHKTVATRAGMGWIGKSALLITPDFGPAVRLITVLTNMPLEVDEPINDSKCGACTKCVDICDGQAIKGVNWTVGMDRSTYYDAFACCQEAEKKCDKENIDARICGQCINVCPYTRKYLEREASK